MSVMSPVNATDANLTGYLQTLMTEASHNHMLVLAPRRFGKTTAVATLKGDNPNWTILDEPTLRDYQDMSSDDLVLGIATPPSGDYASAMELQGVTVMPWNISSYVPDE